MQPGNARGLCPNIQRTMGGSPFWLNPQCLQTYKYMYIYLLYIPDKLSFLDVGCLSTHFIRITVIRSPTKTNKNSYSIG